MTPMWAVLRSPAKSSLFTGLNRLKCKNPTAEPARKLESSSSWCPLSRHKRTPASKSQKLRNRTAKQQDPCGRLGRRRGLVAELLLLLLRGRKLLPKEKKKKTASNRSRWTPTAFCAWSLKQPWIKDDLSQAMFLG